MSLLEQASLILTPNGFKESKLYSVVPSDGAGDMTVVRATTATRVDSEGLIEVTPYNLFTYSEQFDNASWVKERITITTNATTAPNGTLTADKIVEDTTTNSHRVRQNATSEQGIQYTLSYYLKASERTKARINVGGLNAFAYFDLSNGTIIGIPTFCTALIIDANNGWYRCSITYTQTSATSTAQLHLAAPLKEPAAFNYLGDGVSGIFVWGAQLVTGASAKEYFPTTDRLNIPRIDYTSGQGAILVEPQRTNLLPYSVDYSQANWIKTTVTLTSNFATAPDGTTTASKIVATGSDSLLQDIINITSGITYTFSVYLKTTSGTLNTNISLGSPAFPDTEGDGGRTKQIIITNTWQRFTITSTADATADSGISVGGFSSFSTGEEVLVWGAQLEAGSYPTSYIPTVASTVTRNADVISKTGISSLIGQTEGTWYYEGIINNTNSEFQILTSERNVSNTIAITRQTLNRVRARIWSNSTLSIDIVSGSNVFLNTKSKIALSYVSGNVNLFYNGILAASSTNSFAFSSNVGTIELSVMVDFFGSSLNTNNMDSVLIFKTALTDAECIALTTL